MSEKTDNIRIAEWLGWSDLSVNIVDKELYGKVSPADAYRKKVNGNYTTVDAHAIALLPALTIKGYSWGLFDLGGIREEKVEFVVTSLSCDSFYVTRFGSTIASAITKCVLAVIDVEEEKI